MSADYTIGQVVFVVLKKEMRVYPMQVVEIITKKTFEGEVMSYVVRGGSDPKAQLSLSDVDGEVFDSSVRAQAVLIQRATASIEKLVATAVQKATEWYNVELESQQNLPDDPMTVLKKNVEPVKSKSNRSKSHTNEVADFKQELLEESNGGSLITLPDGTKAKVRSVKLPDSFS